MTAIAFDTQHNLDDPLLAPVVPVPRPRPALRVIEGGGQATPQLAPTVQRPARASEQVRRNRFLALLAVSVLIVSICLAAGVSLTSFGPTTAAPVDEATPIVHIVRPFDTYPGIAAALGADEPNVAAQAIRQANGFAELVVGQRLVLDRAVVAG